jgi:hypothetical protein
MIVLPEDHCHALGDEPRHDVHRPAGGERDDDPDQPVRIGLPDRGSHAETGHTGKRRRDQERLPQCQANSHGNLPRAILP